jgi:uncharacterized protein (DUF58 family)
LTSAGWGVLVIGSLALVAGRLLGWSELIVLGGSALLLVGLGVIVVLLPPLATADLHVHPTRTHVDGEARAELVLRAGPVPLLAPVVEVPVDGRGPTRIRLPFVPPGRERSEAIAVSTSRRGIHHIGPATHLRSDIMGLVRRQHTWASATKLYVRPRIVELESLKGGFVHDLEGVVSDRLSASDLAFHALREYAPGDDLRHVHWRSSARASGLLVRQYEETHRAHITVVVDERRSSYRTRSEYELAVSLAASVALRATQDDFDVYLVSGDVAVAATMPDPLLDACCRMSLAGEDLGPVCVRAGTLATRTSLVFVISGSQIDVPELQLAGSSFPADALRLLVRADRAGASSAVISGGFVAMTIRELSHLPQALQSIVP